MVEIKIVQRPDDVLEFKLIGTEAQILSYFQALADEAAEETREAILAELDRPPVNEEIEEDVMGDEIQVMGGALLKRPKWSKIRKKIRNGLELFVPPMKDYCVRYTQLGFEHAKTISVRGGKEVARIYAHAKWGDANVKALDKGACAKEY